MLFAPRLVTPPAMFFLSLTTEVPQVKSYVSLVALQSVNIPIPKKSELRILINSSVMLAHRGHPFEAGSINPTCPFNLAIGGDPASSVVPFTSEI